MFNSLKRNLNVFHCYKKSESPKDSLFYSHSQPSLPARLAPHPSHSSHHSHSSHRSHRSHLSHSHPTHPPLPSLPSLPVRLAPPFRLVPLRGFGGYSASLPLRVTPRFSFKSQLILNHLKNKFKKS